MTNCPRCNAPVLQGYDHCTNCGLAFQPVRGQQPPQGAVPPAQGGGPAPSPGKAAQNPAYTLAAKIDTQGLIWMITGIGQIAFAIICALSYLIIFINCANALKVIPPDQVSSIAYYKQNQLTAAIVMIAMIGLAFIGFLNYADGKKRKDNAGWVIANPNMVMDEFSPVHSYLSALVRNLAFLPLLGLNLSGNFFPGRVVFAGLLGLIGLGFLLHIRYKVLKQVQPPSR